MLAWLFRFAARLPLRVLHALGSALGRLALALSSSWRRKTVDNLRTAGLFSDELLREAARQAGRGLLETPYVWFRPRSELESLVRLDNMSLIQEAVAAGRGAIVLTPHLGCFEVAARMAARLVPMTVLYKPPKLEAVRRLVEQARAVPGMRAVPANAGGVRSLLRALRRGEAIGILPDQVPGDGDGAWAPFFGRPAYTMTLPQRLAELTGATVLMAAAERLPGGAGYRVHIERLEGEASPAAVNAAMEALIRRFPAQYYWGYNRYKTPARARAAGEGAEA